MLQTQITKEIHDISLNKVCSITVAENAGYRVHKTFAIVPFYQSAIAVGIFKGTF